MTPSRLRPRLHAHFEMLLPGQPVWDIGCDHGYLGEAAWRTGQFDEIHFVDRLPAVIADLKARLAAFPDGADGAALHFHALDATSKVLPISSGNVVMAGVGGYTVIKILQHQFPRVNPNVRLILSPQRDMLMVRDFLNQTGWRLVTDQLIAERNTFYELLVCGSVGERLRYFGNHFARKSPDLYRAYLQERLRYYQKRRRSDPRADDLIARIQHLQSQLDPLFDSGH